MQLNQSQNPGIYIHIPFCEHKCGYCDFFSVTDSSQRPHFIPALQQEILLLAEKINTSDTFDTVYFGGGTPSLLSAAEIQHILNTLRQTFNISAGAEITLEANPGTLNRDKLDAFRASGINRLSLGVQSFNDAELNFLERIHNADQALQIVFEAQQAGFEHLSLDLIFAQPGQSFDSWKSSLDTALKLPVDHISAYNLIYEEGTPFYAALKAGQIVPQPEQDEIDFWNFTRDYLMANGFWPYEVSNFARDPQSQSRHNIKYWTHTPYLGFGPSAHSFWGNRRWSNKRNVDFYIQELSEKRQPLGSEETLTAATLEFEHIFLRLRTYGGLNLTEFKDKFNASFIDKYDAYCHDLKERGLAESDERIFRLTAKGMLLCDAILPEFYRP